MSPEDSEPVDDEPDERAQPQMSIANQKRLSQKRMALQIGSPNMKAKDGNGKNDYYDLKSGSDKGKNKPYESSRLVSKCNSKQSMAISMRDESIL